MTTNRPGSRSARGTARRVAGVVALAATLLAGGQGPAPAASAPHWDGDPNTVGSFDPALSIEPTTAIADSTSGGTFTIRVNQSDRQEVIRKHRVVVPGWRFNVGNIPRAHSSIANCGAATDFSTSSATAVPAKMEAVGRIGVRLHTDGPTGAPGEYSTRDPNSYFDATTNTTNIPTGPARYGSFGFTGTTGNDIVARSLWFHRWDPDIDPVTGTPMGTGTATLCGRAVRAENKRSPGGDLMVEVLLKRRSDASWEISWDFLRVNGDTSNRSILDKAAFQNGDVSILDVELTFFRLTLGNYNGCPSGPPGGEKCPNPIVAGPPQVDYRKPLLFAQAPINPGDYAVTGTFTPCRVTDTPLLPCSSSVDEAVRTRTIKVTPPPSEFIRDFGRMTGPSGPGSSMPKGFALIQGETSVPFTWDQPVTHPHFPVKGYVLAVARPYDQSTLHYEYLITNKDYVPAPGVPGFDPRMPCGEDGLSSECSLTLTFPLDTVGGTKLTPDGKLAVALITVYADGGRTDRLCDDGTPQGTECPATMPPISVAQYLDLSELWWNGGRHGISGLEFLMLPKKWPNVFLQTVELTPSGANFKVKMPAALLLANFSSTPKDAAYVLWGPHGTTFETFPGTGQTGIQGQDGQSGAGVVSFGLHAGTNKHYRFDGVIQGASAQGNFLKYDAQQVMSRIAALPNTNTSSIANFPSTTDCAPVSKFVGITCLPFGGTRI